MGQLQAAEQDGPDGSDNTAGTFYQMAWTLTPQLADICVQVVLSLYQSARVPALQLLALQANAALPDLIDGNSGKNFNLITVDWYEAGRAQSVIDIAVALSLQG